MSLSEQAARANLRQWQALASDPFAEGVRRAAIAAAEEQGRREMREQWAAALAEAVQSPDPYRLYETLRAVRCDGCQGSFDLDEVMITRDDEVICAACRAAPYLGEED